MCASMRSPRSRPWTARSRSCRCSRRTAPVPQLVPARHHDLFAALHRERTGHRRVEAHDTDTRFLAFLSGSSGPPNYVIDEDGGAGRAAPRDGQLRRPQAPQRDGVAGRAPAIRRALHPDPRLLDEPGRGLVRHRRAASHPPRVFKSVKDLDAKIRTYIDGWNNRRASLRLGPRNRRPDPQEGET